MALADQLSQHFTAAVRKKGSSYSRNHRTRVEEIGSTRLEAEVQGSRGREYDVSIDWSDGDSVVTYCSCPHYDGGNFCKHLWATIEEASKTGLAKNLASRRSLFLIHEHENEYYDDEDLDYTSYAFDSKRSVKEKAWNWQEELNAINVPNQRAKLEDMLRGQPTRVYYVLDVTESFSSGSLAIAFYQQRTRKDGSWGKSKQLSVSREDVATYDPQDAEVLGLALGNVLGDSRHGYFGNASYAYSGSRFSRADLTAAAHEAILPKLCATERFGWVMGREQGVEDCQPIEWDGDNKWRPQIRIDANDKKKRWTLVGEFTRPDGKGGFETIPLDSAIVVMRNGAVLFEDRIGLFDADCDFRWIKLLRANDKVHIPYADKQQLLTNLWDSEKTIDVVWPANLVPVSSVGAPVGHLLIHPEPDRSKPSPWNRSTKSELYADVHFKYGETFVPPDYPGRGIVVAHSDELVERNWQAESELLQQLRNLKIVPRAHHYYDQDLPGRVEFASRQLPGIVSELVGQGWLVEAEGHKIVAAGDLSINLTSGVDWFDLESEIDFGEATASLPALLAAAKSNDRYVQLDDGSHGMLPQEWLDRFAPLAELAEVEGDRLRFKPSQALIIDALLAEREQEVSIAVDSQFSTFRKKLQSFAGVAPAKAPRGFRGELRPYQQQGLGWLKFLEEFSLGGCLADDMGLGKTVQVLALLLSRRQRRLAAGETRLPSLVVAPKSVVFNWQLEAERFAPTLKVLDYTGIDRKEHRENLADYNVIVTTYGTLRRDIELLGNQPFDYVVLDEAQAIKNDKSLSAKACRLLDAKHRLTLSGTPIENHLGELWSQFEFLNPGMLGRSSSFRGLAKKVGQMEDEKQEAAVATLRRGLAPFLLRRTKDEVLTDLPEKNEQTLYCDLLPKDRKQYDDLKAYYRDSLLKRIDTSGMNKSKMHVLEALLRLRQAACHPGLIDKGLVGRPSAKLDALVEQLTEVAAEGHKALVFSQFTSMLAIVRDRLDQQGIAYEYLDGRTRKRQDKVDRFQSDDACSAFLISLKAGGTGLNLTAADYVFLLDPWWNPAVEAQAIDRAHRIGQTRRVFAYRLIARNTVEEKVLELQQRKRKLADAIVSGNGAVLGNLTVDDLQMLLS